MIISQSCCAHQIEKLRVHTVIEYVDMKSPYDIRLGMIVSLSRHGRHHEACTDRLRLLDLKSAKVLKHPTKDLGLVENKDSSIPMIKVIRILQSGEELIVGQK